MRNQADRYLSFFDSGTELANYSYKDLFMLVYFLIVRLVRALSGSGIPGNRTIFQPSAFPQNGMQTLSFGTMQTCILQDKVVVGK